jgi:putative RNA 2'-phosphotransferase
LAVQEQRRVVKLSRFLALILRHQPARFGLAPDGEGWVPMAEVMEILHGLPNFRWATRLDVMEVVERGSGDGRLRFEVQDNRIRFRPTRPRQAPDEADAPSQE